MSETGEYCIGLQVVLLSGSGKGGVQRYDLSDVRWKNGADMVDEV